MTEHEFNTIFYKYKMYLFKYVNKTIGNQHDAEEITSSVFIKLWESQPDILTDTKTKAWLFLCAKRKCFDYTKTNKTRMIREQLWTDTLPEWEELNLLEPDVHTLVLEKITNLLKEYTQQEKIVFNLHFIEGLKTEDISKILKSKPQTVRNQLTSIRNKMRGKIKKGQ